MKIFNYIKKVFNRQVISIIFLSTIFVYTILYCVSINFVSNYPISDLCIVIDAGHGGRDGGAIGIDGTIESELNLEYAFALKDLCIKAGFEVLMTRYDNNGLYSLTSTNKKISDLNNRISIIENADPDIVISIHMNSISDTSVSGAMVYFTNDNSESLANTITQTYSAYLNNSYTSPKNDDLYILKNISYPAVLIECGFLSNYEEEKLLNTDEYMQKFVYTTLSSILLYTGYISL